MMYKEASAGFLEAMTTSEQTTSFTTSSSNQKIQKDAIQEYKESVKQRDIYNQNEKCVRVNNHTQSTQDVLKTFIQHPKHTGDVK